MENSFLEDGNKSNCNGCGICALVCPKKCIKMVEDEEGFLYPKIDKEKCIKCNKCKKICSNTNLSEINNKDTKVYAVINKDDNIRRKSSSGGVFWELVKYVIEREGIVFGACYNERMEVIHDSAITLEECSKFRGSKYVRSNINGSYEKVEKYLKQDKYVLFTGTPCQVNGLLNFLQKDYKKLITCNIICHANPSPKVFKNYIKEKENEKNKKIVNVEFRSKENGWRKQIPILYYQDGTKEEENIFHKAFSTELINRPSCYKCKFANNPMVGDFTIGDFWGVEEFLKSMDDNKGTSILFVNNDKGKETFKDIKDNFKYEEITVQQALAKNHNKPISINKRRTKFFKEMNKTGVTIKYLEKYGKKTVLQRIKKKLKIR